MNTQQSQLTQPEIDALVTQLSEKFDITQIQKLSYTDIQKVADKYLSSEDQDFKDIGQELKNIDPKVFDLSPAEALLQQLMDVLKKLGKSKYQSDRFAIAVLKIAIEATVQEIVSEMNEESANEWENLQAFNPNILQQTYLLDETSKLLLGKSFDQLYEENLDKSVKVAAQILTQKRDSSEMTKTLNEEQSEVVKTAFDSNQYEIAIQLIYNFVKENAANN